VKIVALHIHFCSPGQIEEIRDLTSDFNHLES